MVQDPPHHSSGCSMRRCRDLTWQLQKCASNPRVDLVYYWKSNKKSIFSQIFDQFDKFFWQGISEIQVGSFWFLIRNDGKLGQRPTLEDPKGGACTKPVPLGQQLGQAKPVPVGQADWDRLCLSQWDRQAGLYQTCPTGARKGQKRPLLVPWDHIPTLEAFPCPGTNSIPTMQLVALEFHLSQIVRQRRFTVQVCSTKWVTNFVVQYLYLWNFMTFFAPS